jgi:hypothetical protein
MFLRLEIVVQLVARNGGHMSGEVFPIRYRFSFPDGETKEFAIALEKPSLRLVAADPDRPLPVWTDLLHHQCPNCPLAPAEHACCPVARNLVGVVEAFSHVLSHEESDVEVTTPARTYSARVKNTNAVGSLIGIYMVTSGCPILDRLRPMVLTHLPFATTEESVYRSLSMYLLAQYFRHRKGLEPDWNLERFASFYEEVNTVNRAFVKRLTVAVESDASLNALVLLNCFAVATRKTALQEKFPEIEEMFSAYLNSGPGLS